jgi:hypothetical protein
MEKPIGRKVQFGICEKCYTHLSVKGDILLESYLDACVYHTYTGCAIPLSTLEDKYPIHIDFVLKQLEIEKFIITHETLQGVFVLPLICAKHRAIPIFCSNRSIGCSKVVLEQNFND